MRLVAFVSANPSRNLKLDGFEECADFVARQIKTGKVGHFVHVSDTGTLRVTRYDRERKNPLPDAWLVGSYTYANLRTEFIEDDLLARQRELAA